MVVGAVSHSQKSSFMIDGPFLDEASQDGSHWPLVLLASCVSVSLGAACLAGSRRLQSPLKRAHFNQFAWRPSSHLSSLHALAGL